MLMAFSWEFYINWQFLISLSATRGSGVYPNDPFGGDFEFFTTSWAMDHVTADINKDINQKLVKIVRILFRTHFFLIIFWNAPDWQFIKFNDRLFMELADFAIKLVHVILGSTHETSKYGLLNHCYLIIFLHIKSSLNKLDTLKIILK